MSSPKTKGGGCHPSERSKVRTGKVVVVFVRKERSRKCELVGEAKCTADKA